MGQGFALKKIQVDSVEGVIDVSNSSTTPLGSGSTFTGTGVDVSKYPSIVVSCKTDQVGILYIEFSTDGINWDSSLSYNVTSSLSDTHRLSVTRKYFRVRFTNTSSSPQSYFRLQSIIGHQTQLTSALNSVIQSDQDTIATRPMDFNIMIAEGLYQNRNNTIKDGINFNISTGSVPEDLTNEGGVYAGFPAAAGAAEIVVSGADTGTVYYSYMATDTDTDYTFGSKAVTGAGTYTLGHNIWRCNFAYFVKNSTTAFNVGDITIRLTSSPSTVFCVITTGYSQSYCSAYTVPYGSSIYIDRLSGAVKGSTSGFMDGYMYYRPYGESPRLRFPFALQFGALYFDDIDYLVKIPERTDIVPRIASASANNLEAQFSYRFIKVKQ